MPREVIVDDGADTGGLRLAEALRLIRTRAGLTKTAAAEHDGAPDRRVLSDWENRREIPTLELIERYLAALDLDVRDLQEALDQVEDQLAQEPLNLGESVTALALLGFSLILFGVTMSTRYRQR